MKTTIPVLVNCHRVPVSPSAQLELTQWLARIIREAAPPDALVQADLASGVINILPPGEGGLLMRKGEGSL